MNTCFCSATIASIFSTVSSIFWSFFFCWSSCLCSYSSCAVRRVRWVSNSSLHKHNKSNAVFPPVAHRLSVSDIFRDVLVVLLFVKLHSLFQVLLLILFDVVHTYLRAEVSKHQVLDLKTTEGANIWWVIHCSGGSLVRTQNFHRI